MVQLMADETYEERLARYESMKRDRELGGSLRSIASAYGVSAERVRQILKAPPMPDGYRRGDATGLPTTRRRRRLEARIAHWSQYQSDYAKTVVAATEQELKEMADA
jgi:hypothetical protein